MPGAVQTRSRKAQDSLDSEPAAKKVRTESSKARDRAKNSLKSAVFTNGVPNKLDAQLASSSKAKSGHVVEDARTAISTAIGQVPKPKNADVVEISSDPSSSDEEDDPDDEPAEGSAEKKTNGVSASEDESENDEDPNVQNGVSNDSDKENEMDLDPDAPTEEPTFGELIQAAPIDVESAFHSANAESPAPLAPHLSPNKLAPVTATSLSTVLTQALKTNDRELLESCFLTLDLDSVRATISRLQPSLVETLLHRIADKLHKRPGRANNLMVWVQWSLVSHGGYLATRKDVVDKLGSLNRVIRERANGLQPLLALKGKLDMLSAQLELRREAMEANRRDLEDEDDLVIYVEGEEDELRKLKAGEEVEEEDDVEAGVDLNDELLTGVVDDDEEDSEESDNLDDDEVSDEGFSDHEEDLDDESESGSEEEDSEEELPQPSKKGKKK